MSASLHKPTKKNNTDGPFIYRDLKKVIISILFEKVCFVWKHSPVINRRGGSGGGEGVGRRMSWVEKNRKIN